MTKERRLAAAESDLRPVELVLRWVEEIHAYDDMSAYLDALAERRLGDYPMDRLGRQAKANAEARSRGKPRAEGHAAIRRDVVDTLFRAQLVLEINVRTQDWLDRQGLIHLVLVTQVGLAVAGSKEPFSAEGLSRLVLSRDLLQFHVDELRAFQTARERVEARYLNGVRASACMSFLVCQNRHDRLHISDSRASRLRCLA
jgi:hypothetical protein